MNQPTIEVEVTTLTHYSPDDSAQIGTLLMQLSSRFSGQPIDEALLTSIITSPSHDQLVARTNDGRIVGTATLSLLLGAGDAHGAWLENFVVDQALQRAGVGGLLWDAMVAWCKDHDAKTLRFTSKPERISAHKFYLKHGAVIGDTVYFKKSID